MVSVTPAGPLSVPVSLLAEIVSESAACQARFGVGSAAELLARLSWGDVRARPGQGLSYPLVTVATSDQFSFEHIAGGGQNQLQPNAGLVLLFADVDRFPASHRDSFLDFANWVGGTLAEIADRAALDGRLAITSIATLLAPGLAQEETGQDLPVWDAIYLIQAT